MFELNYKANGKILFITHSSNRFFAELALHKGGSLQKLKLNDIEIIKDLHPLTYEGTYASSILFPFANRIKDGKYTFKGKHFQFPINVAEENNALHGLVFNKTFSLVESHLNKNSAKIILEYNEKDKAICFPFTYNLQLIYTFTEGEINLEMKVKNTSSSSFPFTVGWHPYFYTNNLQDCSLQFNAKNKMILDDSNITIDTKTVKSCETIAIENNQFDDCWELKSDTVVFTTPDYKLTFHATGNNNFLQVYTPPKKDTIAIEQTTGVSDSFNNQIGLANLPANEAYQINWSLLLENK